jgi:2'-5' RNA ligase
MLYVLAYPKFEPLVADRIERFRNAHEPERALLVPPHITLVFGLSTANAAEMLDLCAKTAREVAPLDITFSHGEPSYDPFERTHKLFLMCDTGKDAIISLHRRLYDGPHRSELSADTPYQPHMTIASHSDPACIAALNKDDIGPFPIPGRLQSLNVVKVANEQLTTLQCIPLSG